MYVAHSYRNILLLQKSEFKMVMHIGIAYWYGIALNPYKSAAVAEKYKVKIAKKVVRRKHVAVRAAGKWKLWK